MSKKSKTTTKLIANPGSGKGNKKSAIIEEIIRTLKNLDVNVDVAIAHPKEKAFSIARKAVKDGYKTILVMGGDDTVETVIRSIAGSKVHLGIIPTGTANNLAKCLGIPEEIQEACALIAPGNLRKLDLGEVKVRKGKKIPFFELVVIGIGAAIYPDSLKTEKGKLSNIKGVIQKIVNHETKPKVTLEMGDEGSLTVETMLAVVSNVPLVGPNMLVTPDASMEDGLFDISLYPEFSKAELLSYSTKVLNQGTAKDGKIQRYRARKLKIKTSPKLEVMADGVMLGKGTVKIKVLPGALRMIAPQVGTGVEKPMPEESATLPPPVSPVPENNNGGQSVKIHE